MGPDLQKFLPARRRRRRLGLPSRRRLALHHPPRSRRRNDGRRRLHTNPHGQEINLEPGPSPSRSPPRHPAHGVASPHRTLHGIEDRALANRPGLPVDDRPLLLHLRPNRSRSSCSGSDANRRLLLRHSLRQLGRSHRLLQQPRLRPDAFHPNHRRAINGVARSLRPQRRSRGPRSSRRSLRLLRGSRRTHAGFQSRLHPRRHAAQHPDRRADLRSAFRAW